MKIINYFSMTILLLSASTVAAQEFRLGKVSIAELEQKVHPKDSSASAAILYKKGKSRITYNQTEGFVTTTEVETRIKIYNKDGYDWANQAVWYYNYTNLSEKVYFSDAATYNLVNNKIEKTKLNSDGIFDEEVNKYRRKKKLTMPNVKEGSIIEFKYTIQSPREGIIRDWDFQTSIPVNYSEFNTYIPEYYVFKPRQKGYIFPKITTSTKNESIIITSKERIGLINSRTEFSQDKIDYIETQTTYLAENFPALKDEAYVNNIDNYTASVSHELAMTKFPNGGYKSYSTDWNSVVNTIYEYEDFGPELNKTGYFEDDLKNLLTGLNTTEEKIWAIFNHVKSNVNWNNYHGYGCDNGVRKAYKEKTGNIADINLMLTAMLRHSGLTANPVLVSTRSNGIALFPTRTAYNYVIAAVETPNGYILLDASDKFAAPNVLPLRVLNWKGRLIRKDGSSEEINLMPKKNSNDTVLMTYSINADGKVTGKTKRLCADYNGMITRNNISKLKEDEYLEKLENQYAKIEISDYSKTNEKDILSPMIESYSFTGNNLCELIGDKMYINPMLFFTKSKNPFKQEVREYPVDFSFPFTDKYNISIQIPDGFAVESLPTPSRLTMENNLGNFNFNIAANGNSLQLSISQQINEAIVTPDKYDMLKEYFKAVVAKESEKIVLKKI